MQDVIFKDIEMWNFRSHEHMTMDFLPNRFLVITGENGAGKSTIFDALCWSLYDLTTNKRKGDAVIRKRAGKNTGVVANFDVGEDEYRIENYRKHKEKKDGKFLYKNDELVSADRKTVNKLIEELLMPYDIFINCLMFSQYMKKSFTGMTDGAQKDILDAMLGLGIYSDYYDKFKDAGKALELEIEKEENLKPVWEDRIGQAKLAEIEETRQLKEIEKEQKTTEKSLKADVKKYKESVKSTSESLKELPKLEKESDKLLKSQAELEQQIKSKEEEKEAAIRELKLVIDAEKTQSETEMGSKSKDAVAEIEKGIETTRSEFKVFSTEIQGQLNNLKNEHQAKISEIDIEKTERVKPLSDELLIVRPKRDSAQDTLLELEVILENSSIELKTIQDQLKQECPTCFTCGQDIKDESLNKVMTEFDGKKKTFGELKDKKAKSKEEFDIQQSRAKEILKETDVIVVDINKKKEEVDAWKEESKTKLENSYNSRKVTFDAEEAKFNELLTNLQSTIKGHLDELSVLFEDKMSDETEKINITHLKKITEMREKLSGITDSLADIKSKIEDFNEAKEYVDGLKSNIASTEATIKSNAENFVKQVTQKEVLLASHQKEIADTRVKVDAIDAKTTDARRKLDIIDFWKKGFSNTGIKAIVLDEAKPILNEKARELSALTDCIRVTFDTQKQIGSGELRNKFSVMAIQTRNLTDDREDFSGGEGKLVDIITLLALRHLLEKMHDVRFNLMLFDEVLDALDPANVEIILNVFRRMSDDYCVALITHTLREAIEANEVLSL